MSKHDSAPTHGWIIGSRINKWVAGLFFILLIAIIAESLWVFSAVNRDCRQPYKIRNVFGSHWIVILTGSNRDGCSDAY